jgi:hypothetical protein
MRTKLTEIEECGFSAQAMALTGGWLRQGADDVRGGLGDWLNRFRLPARLDATQTAKLLGFQPHDIPVLMAAKLLKPLGRPAPNAPKYFAACEIDVLSTDRKWLDKATTEVTDFWKAKNGVRRRTVALEAA